MKVTLKLIVDDSTEIRYDLTIQDKEIIEMLTQDIKDATYKLDYVKGKKVINDFLDGKYAQKNKNIRN
jgi:hypothetical protein